MKLHASAGGSEYELEIRLEGERVHARVGGRNYELEYENTADGSYFLICNGLVFDCRVEGNPQAGKPVDVIVGTTRQTVTISDPKRLRGAASVSVHGDEAARITASMPGKVVRVLVEAGAHVEIGDGIVVVEAMKMQNEMKSPRAGTVVTLNVDVGATVNAGDVLAVVE